MVTVCTEIIQITDTHLSSKSKRQRWKSIRKLLIAPAPSFRFKLFRFWKIFRHPPTNNSRNYNGYLDYENYMVTHSTILILILHMQKNIMGLHKFYSNWKALGKQCFSYCRWDGIDCERYCRAVELSAIAIPPLKFSCSVQYSLMLDRKASFQ